jgi:anaerobic magnesium-protoporphyrin IX monomethyl ester cyclase
MNILLLNPPTPEGRKFIREGRCTQEIGVWGTLWPPISLASIAAVLERERQRVQVIDCPAESMNLGQLEKRIVKFSPRAVIWSTGTPSISGDLELGSFVKKLDARILTVIFGTHATVFSQEILRERPAIDAVVRNEPELAVRDLITAFAAAKNFEGIKGVTFRDRNGNVVANERREFIDPLDQLPFPAWHLVRSGDYRLPLKGDRFLIINPIRGCPYRCSFCTSRIFYGEKIRKRSIPAVIGEIRSIMENLDVREFLIWSETFTVDKTYANDFCRSVLESGLKFSWVCNSRVDTVDEGMLRNMAGAGCWMISFGIESGNQDVLDRCGKHMKIADIQPAVQMARNAGLKVSGHFVFGLPGETPETMERTASLSLALGLDFVQYYCAVPFPGTELYTQALEMGWLRSCRWEDYNQDTAVLDFPRLSAGEIQRFREKAFREFYLRPRTGIRLLRMLNRKGLKVLFQRAKDFKGWTRS